jgi:Fe-S cluster biogenesis protein NfuA
MDEGNVIRSEIDRRNPALCRFMLSRTLYIGSVSYNSWEEAHGSLLAEKLFEIENIEKVQMIGHLLIVNKSGDRDWKEIGQQIEAILDAYFISGMALTREQVEDRMMLIGRGVKEKVQYLIDHHINPGVAAHAGFVELIDIKDNNVYLRLRGGCQGCGAADFTLKQGVEAIIRREVPEIQQIIDLTDHAAGMNPYYRPTNSNTIT